mmetsp:Transcript_41228/g.123071  ORF Transcript_41228/g.123071 Transcript_41228/m.123071 type:complete len:84 (-) Transcript_41228:283-534(-)|eukprot:354077-Chlamydomonas_euryale.AAC.4
MRVRMGNGVCMCSRNRLTTHGGQACASRQGQAVARGPAARMQLADVHTIDAGAAVGLQGAPPSYAVPAHLTLSKASCGAWHGS